MKKYKNIFIFLSLALILFNSHLLYTNFRLNRYVSEIAYINANENESDKIHNESNIKDLKRILEEPEQEIISLIKVITISGDRLSFKAEAKELDEIERLHTRLSRLYDPKKITVNITRQSDNYDALFEYID